VDLFYDGRVRSFYLKYCMHNAMQSGTTLDIEAHRVAAVREIIDLDSLLIGKLFICNIDIFSIVGM
jgi:hypothetical protein